MTVLVVPKDRRLRPDVGLDVPVAGLDRQARCRAAWTRVAWMGAQVGGVDLVSRPALGPCRQRLVGRLRRRDALGWEVHERPVDRLVCTWSGVVARGLGARQGGRRRHHPPTRGHPIGAPLKTLGAGVVIKTRPTIPREGWRDRL
jgi:hypothetical protein